MKICWEEVTKNLLKNKLIKNVISNWELRIILNFGDFLTAVIFRLSSSIWNFPDKNEIDLRINPVNYISNFSRTRFIARRFIHWRLVILPILTPIPMVDMRGMKRKLMILISNNMRISNISSNRKVLPWIHAINWLMGTHKG